MPPFSSHGGRVAEWPRRRRRRRRDPGEFEKVQSYHSDYGKKTYKEIKDLAGANPPDQKARQMKKLIEQTERLQEKGKGRRS